MKPYDTAQLVMRAFWATSIGLLLMNALVALLWPSWAEPDTSTSMDTVAAVFILCFVGEAVYVLMRRRAERRGHMRDRDDAR